MAAFIIRGCVKDYAWGTTDYLPSLLGYGNNGRPQAEYWLGTHQGGEAVTSSGALLSSAIGHRLPFLFKILSIKEPLSLQCHPSKKQAEDGWRREEEARREGRACNYTDDNEKAEVLSALTPVTALCGFRPLEEALTALRTYMPETYAAHLAGKAEDIGELFFSLYALTPQERSEAVAEAVENLLSSPVPSEDGAWLTAKGIVLKAAEIYPGDIGAVFPLIMNTVTLSPGEAVYLEPDTLHAYVRGDGVELMTASDNVLRGGLTPKRIDLEELSRIMYFGPTAVGNVKTEDEGGITRYITPSPDFTLRKAGNGTFPIPSSDTVIIVTEGAATIVEKSGSLEVGKGCAAFIPCDTECTITVEGTVYMASGRRV